MSTNIDVNFLGLSLHGVLVGHLAGFRNGKNSLIFSEEFQHDSNRPTFSLITHPSFPKSQALISKIWENNHRLHPSLSNLLPEGALRELVAQALKVHVDNDFQILSYLGEDLPGALVATALDPDEVPNHILLKLGEGKAVEFDENFYERKARENKFSLAGVQMKFSMKAKDGRYNLSKEGALGDWIIKTPSTQHKDVPQNEFTAMTLASVAGVNVPDMKLVELNKLDNLPPIKLPDEPYAFAIKRFDRKGGQRIHMEDFAQVLVKQPSQKYGASNYENIGKVLYQYSGDRLADVQQFARRLLVNILLANGDAHLKNWSLLYSDMRTPRLSPAYDVVTTSVYIEGEKEFALNLNKGKNWYKVNFLHFEAWARKADIPWNVVKLHLEDTMDKARTLWPEKIQDLPMNEEHKKQLKEHWSKLHPDFKIN
ncbi:type II toxin-antitoxin system HipA family toxin [Arenicella xantha]|uniref:Serine/threonine-protein kinase HipA n=1 Tax=Arenicella xantha TaxID=644221 RepID=A0A395JP34_9GAMM|nr:type II toxin-antitoxin system HipA family toxin [Arenicella xantha]RBP51328.1 serine/threonine-protein kinase HipA [Arenicella xantha]